MSRLDLILLAVLALVVAYIIWKLDDVADWLGSMGQKAKAGLLSTAVKSKEAAKVGAVEASKVALSSMPFAGLFTSGR